MVGSLDDNDADCTAIQRSGIAVIVAKNLRSTVLNIIIFNYNIERIIPITYLYSTTTNLELNEYSPFYLCFKNRNPAPN